MEEVKGENGPFYFSPKSYSPSDVTSDHCIFNSFCLIYKLKQSIPLLKMGWVNPSQVPRLLVITSLGSLTWIFLFTIITLSSFFFFISSFISSIFNFSFILVLNLCSCISSSFFLISFSYFLNRSSRHPFNRSTNSWYLSIFSSVILTHSSTIKSSTLSPIIISWTSYVICV